MVTPADIRAWAINNGWPELAGQRGRMPAAVYAAYEKRNKGAGAKRGTSTPAKSVRPAAKNTGTKEKGCRSAVTLPMGLEAKAIIAEQDGLCSGCENPATEVVALKDGIYSDSLSDWTGLCQSCVCEWRKRVK